MRAEGLTARAKCSFPDRVNDGGSHVIAEFFWDEALADESGRSVKWDVSKEVRQLFSRE